MAWNFVGLNEAAWVDLPCFEEVQAAPYLGKSRNELQRLLESYHQLAQDRLQALEPRRKALQSIAEFCGSRQGIEAESVLFCFRWLERLAQKKELYLSCLEQIFREGWHEGDRLLLYLRDTESQTQEGRPLFLTLERYLFAEHSFFWGNYAMECLDPCHRQLPELFKAWTREGTAIPYLLWLERFSTFHHDRWVRYFGEEDEAEARVSCVDGRLFNGRGRALNCAERQHFLFVIDLQGSLLAARAEPQLCHASFKRGKPLLASGILQARDGRLNHLKFESGHYLSGPADWWQAILLFRSWGVTENEGLRLTVFDRFRYISVKIDLGRLASCDDLCRVLGL